jgi:hypothetical protein
MNEAEGPKRFDPNALPPAPNKEVRAEPPPADGGQGEAKGAFDARSAKLQGDLEVDGRSRSAAAAYGDLSSLGSDLARVMQEEGYHPVVLFGTNNSGKTSMLMSLFSTLTLEPILDTGLSLCDPILGTRSDIGRQLHKDATHSFEIKTQAYIAGEKIPKTTSPLPFFIPVEFRPPGGLTPVKFAFLESNGEWYRPLISEERTLSDLDKLYPDLRAELESFISNFQNGITFIYTAPVTQGEVYAAAENAYDAKELHYASLAIKGVLNTYDRIRANGRASDRHLMLITKWDALSARSADRALGIEEDPVAVLEFCNRKYGQALAAFQGLNLDPQQRNLNAYCAGMINERGLLPLKQDDEVRGVIASYPVRLWTYLYKNALRASGLEPVSPFREPPGPSPIVKLFNSLLDRISGL